MVKALFNTPSSARQAILRATAHIMPLQLEVKDTGLTEFTNIIYGIF